MKKDQLSVWKIIQRFIHQLLQTESAHVDVLQSVSIMKHSEKLPPDAQDRSVCEQRMKDV